MERFKSEIDAIERKHYGIERIAKLRDCVYVIAFDDTDGCLIDGLHLYKITEEDGCIEIQ